MAITVAVVASVALPAAMPAVMKGAIAGGLGGFVSTGSLKGAMIGAATGAAFAGIGQSLGNLSVDSSLVKTRFVGSINRTVVTGLNSTGRAVKALAHGAVGGLSSAAQGGKFAKGFLSAGVTAGFSPTIAAKLPNDNQQIARIAAGGALGGATSVIAGGKFGDGFVTGAYSTWFNQESSNLVGNARDWLDNVLKRVERLPEATEFRVGRAAGLSGKLKYGKAIDIDVGGRVAAGIEFGQSIPGYPGAPDPYGTIYLGGKGITPLFKFNARVIDFDGTVIGGSEFKGPSTSLEPIQNNEFVFGGTLGTVNFRLTVDLDKLKHD